LQQAFLYCALFPVDSGISREDLVEYMIVEGIVAKRKSRQAESSREGYRCVRMNPTNR
jgi:disease resistance protein RPS2